MKQVYLTIDDGPSATTKEKIDWLVRHEVPAILFMIGAHMVARPEAVSYAIEHGFWVANHSYSHRRFSQLDAATWSNEIACTEGLIDDAYRTSSWSRPPKLFRFPFGDKGDARRAELQTLLRGAGYAQPAFEGVTYSEYAARAYAADADCYWTIESYEYRIADMRENLSALLTRHPRTGGSVDDASSADILLIHDHPNTTDAFFMIISDLLARGVQFRLP